MEKLCQQWQGQSYHLKIINQISEADIIIKGVLEGQLIVVIDDERIIFRDIEKDDTSIPIEVINFNAKVKEILMMENFL